MLQPPPPRKPPSSPPAAAAALPQTMIKRVVSCFILTRSSSSTPRIAVLHRQATMPTFPSHWAACSGSIEANDASPWEAACRELREETNIVQQLPDKLGGLYVDVPLPSRNDDDDAAASSSRATTTPLKAQRKIIRVYPFVVYVPDDFQLELRGTEHDRFDWISVKQLATLQPAVPALFTAFTHATQGQYVDNGIPTVVEAWRADRVNGAATLAKQALQILMDHYSDENNDPVQQMHQLARTMRLMRPTMVAIANALDRVVVDGASPAQVLQDMDTASAALQQRGANLLRALFDQDQQQRKDDPEESLECFTIATFSRSSTLVGIVQQFVQDLGMDHAHNQGKRCIQIHCSQSTPGDEGLLMTQDLLKQEDYGAVLVNCLKDEQLLHAIGNSAVNVVVVGADVVLPNLVVNKVGTRVLAETCVTSYTPILCFSDSFKAWNDVFPPPLEEDLFECIPRHLLRVEMEQA